MPTLTTAAAGPEGWFGFFQGESEGYMFKSCETKDLEATVQNMLDENDDLTIRVITHGEGAWFIHGEHKPYKPKNRSVVVIDDIDGLTLAIIENLEANACMRALHCHEGTWVAYFEGDYGGKRSFATAESNEDMLEKLSDKCGDDELALREIAFGDDVWMMYFEGELLGDASWVFQPDFKEFQGAVASKASEDESMKACVRVNGGWFGYWEGKVKEEEGWAWGCRPTLKDFITHIQEQWDDDQDPTSPSKSPSPMPRGEPVPPPSANQPTITATSEPQTAKEKNDSSPPPDGAPTAKKTEAPAPAPAAATEGGEGGGDAPALSKKEQKAAQKKAAAAEKQRLKEEKQKAKEDAKRAKAEAKEAKKKKK